MWTEVELLDTFYCGEIYDPFDDDPSNPLLIEEFTDSSMYTDPIPGPEEKS